MSKAKHSGKRNTGVCLRWMRTSLFVLLVLPIYGGVSLAASPQRPGESLASIQEAARTFIVDQISRDSPHHEITVSDLDPRLNLAACQQPLEGFLPPGGHLSGNTTIGVRCPAAKPWTVYVPAVVKIMRKVVITTRPLLRGSTIAQGDITVEEREVRGKNEAYIFDPVQALGKIVKRPLTAATALTPAVLDAPLLVRRGQRVIILAQGSGIEVRMMGTALMNGAKGALIRAKNTVSKRTVEGLVVQPGIIQVNM